jgi:hypothetical protein
MRRRLAALCIDACVVAGFVILGRDSHSEGEGIGGVAIVAAPFLIGLAVGWIASRNTSRPAGLQTGVIVWASTVVIGLALREWAFQRPTPVLFILVAGTFLALLLLGWRVIRGVARRISGRRGPASRLTAS